MDADTPAESSKRRPTQNATTKKRKLETERSGSAPKKPRASRSTKQGRLAGLLSISLDIVFEILGNLHPLDVLRLSRTSKEFRQLLMHKSARPIWRSSLNNVEGMPPCPPHMNEVQWTSLAFDATCQVCQKTARKVDWHLYIRLCSKCVKTHLDSKFRTPSNLMGLIPSRPDMLHFPLDLEKVKTAYNAIKDPQEQQKYAEERRELVKALAQHSKLCETWSENIADNRSAELASRKEERYTAIVARLTGLGWGTEIANLLPMDSLRNHKLVKMPNALTNRTWNTIQPEMVKYMEQMKAKRLEREYVALVTERKAMAAKVLRTFKRSQLPWTEVMPGPLDFSEFSKIKDIISQPASVTVDEQTFEALLPDFPAMIANWRKGLLQHMVAAYKRDSNANAAHADNVIENRLQLAISVFKCGSCGDGSNPFFDDLIFGYQRQNRCQPLFYPKMLAHRCLTRVADYSAMMYLNGELSRDCAWRSNVLKFDARTSEIAEKVVRACGMDPETATVEDMDAADKRLACHACAERGPKVAATGGASNKSPSPAAAESSTSKGKGKSKAAETAEELEPATIHAYDWRSAVRHHGDAHSRFPTAWFMLSDADAAAARALEATASPTTTTTFKWRMGRPLLLETRTRTGGPKEARAQTDTDPDTATTTPTHPGGPLPSELPEVAFSCAHCIDTPRELAPMTLQKMHIHLGMRHEVLTPPVLNEDYYRALAAPEIYSAGKFPAPQLKDVMIALKPDLPSPPPPPTFGWDRYLDSDSEMDDLDGYRWRKTRAGRLQLQLFPGEEQKAEEGILADNEVLP
ncbi:F-box domain-containing protein [Mycena sanguinolenta]|uniref:F-box domain-containing protein n=1 Tax=Mycena sanguinolenta TaxID=230812 RepID=A0A8H6XAL8_9AGAR|nr:F-box domain-containing protein [Mycena sanguinolenta]